MCIFPLHAIIFYAHINNRSRVLIVFIVAAKSYMEVSSEASDVN